MSTRAHATFAVTSWDETVRSNIDDTWQEISGVNYPLRGFSRVDVEYAYSGDLVGSSTLTYLIAYRPGGGPTLALERFVGSVHGVEGSFVLQHVGTADDTGVQMTMNVIDGLGTGGLRTLTGTAGTDIEGHSDTGYGIWLDYDV